MDDEEFETRQKKTIKDAKGAKGIKIWLEKLESMEKILEAETDLGK